MAEFQRHSLTFRVVSLYAPNRNPQRDDFLSYCASKVDPSVPTLVCGDFNAVFDRALERCGFNVFGASRESVRALGALFSDCCVVDAWWALHHSTVAFSWLKPDWSLASRIDLIGCPYSWLHHVLSCKMLPCPFSDHCAVVLNVDIPDPFPQGPGRWILNVSVLKDEDFKQIIMVFRRNWQARKASFSSLLKWWDRGKEKIKGLAIDFCSRRTREKSPGRSLLVCLSSHLKAQIDNGRVSILSVYESVLPKIAAFDLGSS